MDYLQYDTDKMAEIKELYSKSVEAMDNIKADMKQMVDAVEEAWKSDAGDAFFDKYNNEWLKNFQQYSEVISHMAENLNFASSEYSEITRKISALQL